MNSITKGKHQSIFYFISQTQLNWEIKAKLVTKQLGNHLEFLKLEFCYVKNLFFYFKKKEVQFNNYSKKILI